jgi:subtilisin family serine protease
VGLIPAPGREGIPVQVSEVGGHVRLLPQDVAPLLEKGVVDPRLFDITELSREEYAGKAGLGLIVTYGQGRRGGDARAGLRRAAGAGTPLEAIGGEAVTVSPGAAADVWQALTEPAGASTARRAAPGVVSVALDAVVTQALDRSVPQVGAPEAWDAGYDGAGVRIAVLDTGISEEHPDLAGKVTARRNFSHAPDTGDRRGHGTHVASIAAGTGAKSGGKYTGVAPRAELLNGKVLDDRGSGRESWIIQGMQWAVDQGADVVNMSLGSYPSYVDPVADALDALSAESDTLFVVASGNEGSAGVGTPGTAESALTVGAVDKSDVLAEFSGSGDADDRTIKPDVTAPGVEIGAAAAPGSTAEKTGEPVADGYVAATGTSMAAPHVAGAAALLKQRHPDWTGERIKAALTSSAVPGEGYGVRQQGTGRIDVGAAIGRTVVAETGALDFGSTAFPHHDDEPVGRDVTYRNLGGEDVTLKLSARGVDPKGGAAPEGMFSVSVPEVTVPAGGTATVRVTADTRAGGDVHGEYGVYVTAAGDGQTVRTAGVVHREEELVTLTVEAKGRDGRPAPYWLAHVHRLYNTGRSRQAHLYGDGEGAVRVRLPRGTYLVDTTVFHGGADHTSATGLDWLLTPQVSLTEDTTVTVEAADAAEIDMTVADGKAELARQVVAYAMGNAETRWGVGYHWLTPRLPDGVRTAQLGSVPDGYALEYVHAGATWERAGREYHAAHARKGAFFHGLRHHTGWADLARITRREGASVPGATGAVLVHSTAGGMMQLAAARPHALPRTTEVYVRADAGEWTHEFWQLDAQEYAQASQWERWVTHEAGERYHRTFNTGVFGPSVPEGGGLFWFGGTIQGSLNLFTDGGGHRGASVHDTASSTLHRNGEEYARADAPFEDIGFEVPPEKADYRLVTTVSRSAPAASVSTRITVAHTFSLAAPESGELWEEVAIPTSAVRFTPALALDSTAPGRRAMRVPVTVEGSAAGGNLGALAVSVSYDGGRTWHGAPVEDGRVTVRNPAAGGTVSFRAEVSDKQGNTTTQTIVDAYRTR